MTRRLPNLNQLRAFEAAARHLSFKDAAEELCVTQAAVSHQIKALEEFYGCRLFDRLNRKVALTDAARSLAQEIGSAFDAVEIASEKFRSNEMTGVLRISVTPFYANRMVLPWLDEFLAQYPGLSIEFDQSYELADLSQSGADAALRYGLGSWPGLRRTLVHYDRVAPVASPLLLGERTASLSAEAIARLPLAAVEGQEIYWQKWFSEAGLQDFGGARFSLHLHRGLALDFALAGNAVALADLPLITNELKTGSLVQLSPVACTLDRGIHLVEPEGPFADARLAVFGNWLTDRVAAQIS